MAHFERITINRGYLFLSYLIDEELRLGLEQEAAAVVRCCYLLFYRVLFIISSSCFSFPYSTQLFSFTYFYPYTVRYRYHVQHAAARRCQYGSSVIAHSPTFFLFSFFLSHYFSCHIITIQTNPGNNCF